MLSGHLPAVSNIGDSLFRVRVEQFLKLNAELLEHLS